MEKDLARLNTSYFAVVQGVIRDLKGSRISTVKVKAALEKENEWHTEDVVPCDMDVMFAPGSYLSERLDGSNVKLLAHLVNISKSKACHSAFREYCVQFVLHSLKYGGQIVVTENGIAVQNFHHRVKEKLDAGSVCCHALMNGQCH